MKLVLAPHVFFWWTLMPEQVPGPVVATGTDPVTTLLCSTASSWEIHIKAGLEELTLQSPLLDLPMTLDHALRGADLPRYHKDPFDRMCIAQALVEDAVVARADAAVAAYPVAPLRLTPLHDVCLRFGFGRLPSRSAR